MIAIIIFFLYRVILFNIMGAKATGYYAIIADWYYLLMLMSVYCIPVVTSKMMRPYLEKSEYKNVSNIFRGVLSVTTVISAIVGVIVFILGGLMTRYAYGVSGLTATLRTFALQIPVCGILGVYRGALMARNGYRAVTVTAVVEHVFTLFVALLAVSSYIKVGAQSACMAFVGASLCGSFVALMFAVAVYNSSKSRRMRALKRDPSIGYITDSLATRDFMRTSVPLAFCMGTELIVMLADSMIFQVFTRLQGYSESIRMEMYGIYTGAFVFLIAIPLVIVFAWSVYFADRVEIKSAKEDQTAIYIRRAFRSVMLLVIPILFGYYILSGSILSRFLSMENELATMLCRLGYPLIIVLSMAISTQAVLIKLNRKRRLTVHMAIAFGAQCITLVVLLMLTNMNIYALLFSFYVFAVIAVILNMRLIRSIYDLKASWIGIAIMPIFAALIMAVLMWILFHLFVVITHVEILSLIITIILSIIIYLLAAFFLDMISEKDLMILPGGSMIVKACKKVHIL